MIKEVGIWIVSLIIKILTTSAPPQLVESTLLDTMIKALQIFNILTIL